MLKTESGSGKFDLSSLDAKFRKIAGNVTPADFEEKHKSRLEVVRLSMKDFLNNSLLGLGYNQFMLAISVLSCFQFIYQTYLEGHNELLSTFKKLELGIACLFLFDWCLYLFVSEHKWAYLLSFFSLVDLMTVIPIFVLYESVTCPSYESISSGIEGFYYVMCGMNTTRILRALRFRKHFLKMEDEVKQCLSNMSLYIIVMILFNSAVIHYLEPQQHFPFHTWTYYMLVTVATVGYGDITPQTDLGRFAAMAMIGFAIITVPKMTNELIEKIAAQSVYARAVYSPLTANGKASHVLVCGDLKSSSLKEFFEELFHEDHDTQNLQAVILQPESPSYEMLTILKDIAYSQCVTYLEGNTLNEKDLKRASAETAKAIFIMTNKFTSDPDQEDAKTILQQFSIQRYLRLNSVSKVKTLFCMQLIRPENKRHLVAPAEGSEVSDLVACLNEIKMGVIAKAVIFPGANTLIMNLLTSFADEDDGGGGSSVKEDLGIETLDDDVENDWLGEYQRGCDWEIYTTGLADAFEGSVFSHLSEILYQKLGVVLFALQIESKSKDRPWVKLLLNPAQYVIPSKDEFKIEAFVLAKNKAMSDLTFSKQADHDSLLKGGISFSHLSVLAGGLSKGIGNLAPNASHQPGRSGGGGGALRMDDMSTENTYEAGGDIKMRAAAWQALLRKHEMEKTTETIQEENQKLEDKYLRDNFYLKDTGVVTDLADALIRTSVMEEMPYVDNHIIIIGKALSNLYDLIRPLRSKHLGVLKHIVILYPSDFPIAVWQRISIFESIWIVRGSALEEADIRRSGIFRAKQVVVLADASTDSTLPTNSGSAAGLDALTDADAIFCYQCVRRMNETAQVVVEIVRHTNVGYLDPESGMNSSQIDYKFTPQFASGALFASSFLDTLVCQSFYNTKIIDVVNKLIGGVDNRGDADKKNSANKTLFGSSLYQINIPDGLESRTYGALYKLLAKRGQIPLGILRGVFAHTKSGPKANKMPYVFTNPPRDTELFSCDKVFVLSQTPIKIGKGAKDDSKEMMIYQNIRYKKKTAEDIIAMVNVLRDDVKSFEESHYNIDAKVTAMTNEFNHKFEILFNLLNSNKSKAGTIPGTPKSPGGGGSSNNRSRSPSPTYASRVREKRTSSV